MLANEICSLSLKYRQLFENIRILFSQDILFSERNFEKKKVIRNAVHKILKWTNAKFEDKSL